MAEISGYFVSDQISQMIQASIPQPANTVPLTEMNGAVIGTNVSRYAVEDHRHPRLTSTTVHTISSGSTVNVTFTRVFVNKPGVVCTEFEGDNTAAAQPAIFKVQSWVQDANSSYIGCTIKIWRSQVVPQNLSSLLLAAVYNIFTASVVGTQFSCIAVARSDMPAS